jgi:hypothetical protein
VVLDQLKTGQIILADTERGAIEDFGQDAQIEAPYLQIVMKRLWLEAVQSDSRMLSLNTLKQLGGVNHILRTFLDEILQSLSPSEQEIAAQISYYLITPSGLKIAYKGTDLSAYINSPKEDVSSVLRKLSSGQSPILCQVTPPNSTEEPRYQVIHDILAQPFLDWQMRHRQNETPVEAMSTTPEESIPHVFISYVREDADAVPRLSEELRKRCIKVWIDKNSIAPGTRWQRAIRKAIQSGDYFIACFSEHYAKRNKTYMNEELTRAIDELRKRAIDRAWFIPVLLSESEVPDRSIGGGETLTDIQQVRLYEDWNAGIQQILSVIKPC